MKIERIEIAEYELPLTRPLHVGGRSLKTRVGALVRITNDDGHEGYGDMAPLPRLHTETLEEATYTLRDAARPRR